MRKIIDITEFYPKCWSVSFGFLHYIYRYIGNIVKYKVCINPHSKMFRISKYEFLFHWSTMKLFRK